MSKTDISDWLGSASAPNWLTIILVLVPFWLGLVVEARRHKEQEKRSDRREQEELAAKQAILTLTRQPETRPLGVGSAGLDRMLVGTLWNVGMSEADLVRVRAYLNGVELPHWGSWGRQQNIPVGQSLGLRFILPFKIEPPDQTADVRLDERLAGSTVRIEV